jgi:hypothetical protein
MKDQYEVQLAWKIVELLETLTSLIWEHYQNDFNNLMEDLKPDDAWAE